MSVIKRIPAGMLKTPRYQREPASAFIKRQLSKFDERLLGTVVVSKRDDGTYWVIDGLQRKEIVTALFGPNYQLRAEVHEGLTEEDEANLFHALDTQRQRLLVRDHFAGRLRMGGLVEKEIVETCARYGVTVAVSRHGSHGAAMTSAHQILYDLQAAEGDLLDRVLSTAEEAYGREGASNGLILKALGLIYQAYPKIKSEELATKLATYGTHHRLLGEARGLAGGNSRARGTADAMLVIYNKGKSHNRLDPVTSGQIRKPAQPAQEETKASAE